MAFSDLSRDSKAQGSAIRLIELETTALRTQLAELFRRDEDMNNKLDSILHILQPSQPPPGNAVIPLDDDNDLEEVG